MTRKKWQAKTDITPSLLKSREKRKWQITFRRYVLDRSPCPPYAPYFGLDIRNIRKWFEYQFEQGLNWENFGKEWQFDHIIPIAYFDDTDEQELRLCWNFTNIKVGPFKTDKNRGSKLDILGAKAYFDELHKITGYSIVKELKRKVEKIELSELLDTKAQQRFLTDHKDYLTHLENYSSFEFELLNHGRSVEEIQKEMQFLKKNSQI